jgi:osmoprotectant transport system ATP-binding protein
VNTSNTAQAEGPSSHPQAATLEFRNVSKTYPGSAEPAIQDLSFEVPAGDICVLVGPSGCGKTTAMRMVNRMIELSGGDILLDGTSVRTRRPAELRREIGYAIQQIGLFPHQTIGENIATVPRLLGWSRDRIRARVDELIELIGLDPADMRDRYPAQLSGGQRQRVGVARALAADPPLMLMDEPFGAIDPINRERLQNELLRLQERIRKTIVFVTHDIDEAIKIGDRIAVLKQGGVLAQYATPAELLMQPADEFVEDFVGSDRALKRLALQRVRDVDLWRAPRVRVGSTVAAAREAIAGSDLSYPLVVDDEGRPVAWLDEDDLRRDHIEDGAGSPVLTVERDDVLRDALSHLLSNEVQYGAVVDEQGRVDGVLSVEIIHDFLVPEAEGGLERPDADRRDQDAGLDAPRR